MKPGILGDVILTRFLTLLLPFLAWRCGYLLISGKCGRVQKTGIIDHFFYLWPIYGHVIIAILRLFGFRIFRNTYKPLLSQTIVEFWNRYYYYFKELLVEFFFFPAYLSFSKFKLNIRLFVATFAAAFWGNLYDHILRDSRILVKMNLEQLWNVLAPRTLYCLLLATGIFISMLREQKRRGQTIETQTLTGRLNQARRILGVLTFFGLIQIWSLSTDATFIQRMAFFISLFGF